MPDSDPKPETPKPYRSRLGDIPEEHFDNDPAFVEDPKVSDEMADWLADLGKQTPAKDEGPVV